MHVAILRYLSVVARIRGRYCPRKQMCEATAIGATAAEKCVDKVSAFIRPGKYTEMFDVDTEPCKYTENVLRGHRIW
jgi:hypothetical protein